MYLRRIRLLRCGCLASELVDDRSALVLDDDSKADEEEDNAQEDESLVGLTLLPGLGELWGKQRADRQSREQAANVR